MYKVMRYNLATHETIHDFKYISESDLAFLMVNHGHTVFYDFFKKLRENPYCWEDVYRDSYSACVVLWADD